MSFWNLESKLSASSKINEILNRPDHTLEEVLNEPDLLQEVSSPNTTLLEYLRTPEVLDEMVNIIVKPEPQGDDKREDDEEEEEEEEGREEEQERREDEHHRDLEYRQLTSEILSAGVYSLSEALMETNEYLDKIWSILDFEAPLNISYASAFTKINEHLLEKKTSHMLSYIRSQDRFVEKFMKHVDNPPLMDFLLKVVSTDKWGNDDEGIIDFLQDQKLIPSLVAFLGPEVPSSAQSAAGDFLKAFVTISANSNTDNNTIGPNELSRELVSEPVVKELVRLMLYGGTGLVTGVGIVIEIIRKNNSDYDFVPVMYITMESHPPSPRDPIYLGTLVKIFAQNIPKFQEMLTREREDRLDTPFGKIEPLGFERFKICELFAELLHCSNMTLLNDPNGEKVVKERDDERERMKKALRKQRDGGKADSDDATTPGRSMETGIDGLDIRNDRFLEDDDDQQHDDDDDDDDEMEDKEADESIDRDSIKDPNEGQEFDPNAVQSEESIREDPVVGDQLKIALADNNCIPTILKMFFHFPWNNFLHNVVFDICQQVLNGSMDQGYNRYLTIDLFGKGRLTEVICEGHADCEKYEQSHHTRLGYMGHLVLISEEVVKFTAVFAAESISQVIVDAVTKQDWTNYVGHTLVKSREQYNAVLGGERPEDAEPEQNPDTIILKDRDENEEDQDQFASELGEVDQHDNDANDQFARYMSQQFAGAGHQGSSDEEDDEVWDEKKLDNDDDDDSDEDEDEDEEEKDAQQDNNKNDNDDKPSKDNDSDNDDDDDDDLNLTRSKSNKTWSSNDKEQDEEK